MIDTGVDVGAKEMRGEGRDRGTDGRVHGGVGAQLVWRPLVQRMTQVEHS